MVSIEEFIRSNPPEKFQPKPYYSKNGDALTFYFKDVPSYGDRIDSILTIYRSVENDEMVGCQIKGVRHILEKMGSFGVHVDDSVQLSILFWAYLVFTKLHEETLTSSRPMQQLGSVLAETGARFNTAEMVPSGSD
jgi:hypothetical protein